MVIPPIIITLLLGGVAGWLASLIVGGKGGIIRSVIIGLIGAVVGHFVLGALGIWIGGPFLHSFVAAVIGGMIVIVLGRFLGK